MNDIDSVVFFFGLFCFTLTIIAVVITFKEVKNSQ
jgi:hypothetical protein